MKNKSLFLLASLLFLMSAVRDAQAQGTAFTYQGRLTDNSGTASGIYDLRFTIYDLAGGGSGIAGPLTNAAVAVSDGLFTTVLDFGTAAFTGPARWLEIGVRINGSSGDFTTLTPRQPITPTPYALFAGKAAMLADNASQIFTGTIGFNPSTPGAPPFAVVSAAKVNNLNADLFDGLDSANFLLKSEHCLANVAELKARESGFVPCVTVLGYYAPGDGGGGNFYWDASATELDNGGTIIAPGSSPRSGRWRRIYDGLLNVRWFGANGKGTTIDLPFIQNAAAALPNLGGALLFPAGTYNLGNASAGQVLIDLTGKAAFKILGHGAELVCNTVDNSIPTFFKVTNPSNVKFSGLRFRDTGTILSVDWRGAQCILAQASGITGFTSGLFIEDCYAESVVIFLRIQGTTLYRIRNILVERCKVKASYYGINCVENGDALRAIGFECEDVRRSYFPYGVVDHDVDVSIYDSESAIGSDGAIVISRATYDTKRIRVRATFLGVAKHKHAVHFTHVPAIAGNFGLIEDVDIDLSLVRLTSASAMTPVGFTSYPTTGGSPEPTTQNRWDHIRIAGNFGGFNGGECVAVNSAQQSEGALYLHPLLSKWMYPVQVHLPGFVVKVDLDREMRAVNGDLTVATVLIPLAAWDANAFVLRVRIYAQDGQLAFQNTVYREDVIVGYNAGAGPVGIQTVTNLHSIAVGTPPTVTYTASGENINITFAGSQYATAAAYARIEVDNVARFR